MEMVDSVLCIHSARCGDVPTVEESAAICLAKKRRRRLGYHMCHVIHHSDQLASNWLQRVPHCAGWRVLSLQGAPDRRTGKFAREYLPKNAPNYRLFCFD